jgi:hypothetical protein
VTTADQSSQSSYGDRYGLARYLSSQPNHDKKIMQNATLSQRKDDTILLQFELAVQISIINSDNPPVGSRNPTFAGTHTTIQGCSAEAYSMFKPSNLS